MTRWISRVVTALLALTMLRPGTSFAQAVAPAPAPAASAAPAAAAPAAPPGTYRGFPLSPPEAASIPVPDKDTFTVHAKVDAMVAQVTDFIAKNGRSSSVAAGELVHQAFDAPLFEMGRQAYALGWREASHNLIPNVGPRHVYWRVNGNKVQQVSVTMQAGTVTLFPKVTATAGWGDTTYMFSETALPDMGATDFPLCVKAAGKPQHSGNSWTESCGQEDPLHPTSQAPRLFGWSAVKLDAQQRPVLYQKGDRFAEVVPGGNKVKVTLVSEVKKKAALLAQFPALPDGVRTHPVANTGLVLQGSYLPGPYRMELSGGKITATGKTGSGTVWSSSDSRHMPAEVAFDRMSAPGYWPTLRIIAGDGRNFEIRTNDSVEKVVTQVSKIVSDAKTDEPTRAKKLSKLNGGWSNVPESALLEIVKNWKSTK